MMTKLTPMDSEDLARHEQAMRARADSRAFWDASARQSPLEKKRAVACAEACRETWDDAP